MTEHKKQPPKKIFDVMRPGKTLAGPSSRPLIVGHKPEVKDEMVGGSAAKVDSAERRPLLNALAKVTLQPSAHEQAPAKSAVEPEETPAAMPTASPAPAPELSAPAPESPAQATPTPEQPPKTTPLSSIDALLQDPQFTAEPTPAQASEPQPVATTSVTFPSEPKAPAPKPLNDQLLAAAAKEPENPNPMMQHGEHVYVSHHKPRFTFGQALLTMFLIVLLTAVAVNFLLDADVIKTELSIPHTDFL
jgi:hypothetical protein